MKKALSLGIFLLLTLWLAAQNTPHKTRIGASIACNTNWESWSPWEPGFYSRMGLGMEAAVQLRHEVAPKVAFRGAVGTSQIHYRQVIFFDPFGGPRISEIYYQRLQSLWISLGFEPRFGGPAKPFFASGNVEFGGCYQPLTRVSFYRGDELRSSQIIGPTGWVATLGCLFSAGYRHVMANRMEWRIEPQLRFSVPITDGGRVQNSLRSAGLSVGILF